MTIKHEWLGTFRGAELSEEQLDAVLAFALRPGDLETARTLQESKWWDYRFIHPGYGFFLFAHEYSEAVTRWRSMFGVPHFMELHANEHPIWRPRYDRHGKSRVVVGRDLTPPSYRTAMWRAMCYADAYGVPYDRWVGLAFEYAFECKWERMPQPSALYGEQMVKYILDRWEREVADILKLPSDPRYLPANYEGHRWQTSQYGWLIELIRKRPLPHIPLAQYAFREKRLPVDLCVQTLGSEIVERAKRSL